MIPIFLLKSLTFFLRTFTKNSGTALPGLYLEKFFPDTLKKLLNQFDKVVLITGTNGKTTTSRMLCHLLESDKINFISNSSGSNLIRGIASVLVQKSNLFGKIDSKIAVFEVEEATMPRLTKLVKSEIIVVTNIFRDQLDAYGEIDKTYKHIKNSIINSDNPKLILNLDDERVRSLNDSSKNTSLFISYDKKYLDLIKFENKGLGSSNLEKQKTNHIITNVRVNEELGSEFDILLGTEETFLKDLKIQVPGIHNTFNAVAATLCFQEITNEKVNPKSLENFEAAFGRGEILKYKNTDFQVLLVKNPAGMNLNLHLLSGVKSEEREAVLFILNDKIADGRDVSWIWDCDFTLLKDLKFKNIFVGGERRYDMAIRISYELGVLGDGLEENIFDNLGTAIEELGKRGFKKVFVLPTYTAMRDFRDTMGSLVEVKKMYE